MQAIVTRASAADVQVIVVNADHAGERQRFTVAHELGHLYLDVKRSLEPESACHRFSGAFLLPAHVLIREVGDRRRTITPHELFGLKQLFGISAQAIAYRCRDLGVIHQSALASIFRLFNARGWRQKEPLPWRKERPARFERLTIRALAEGLISESKASELLQKPVSEVVEIMDEPPPEENDGRSPRV